MDAVKDRDGAVAVDFGETETIGYLRSLFPEFQGTEFWVAPVDRSMAFTTDEVTAYSAAWVRRHHGEDEW